MTTRLSRIKLTHVCAITAALFAVSLAVHPAHAVVLTWNNGGGDSTWSNTSGALDWTGLAWSDSSDALFAGSGVGTITLGTPINANSVTFTAPGYAISGGNSLTVAGGGISVSSTGTTTISSNVALSAAPFFSVASGGALALGGDLTRPAGTTLRFTGAGTTTLNTINNTAAGTVATNNNGILGGWAYISNGNTGSWATVTGGGPYTVTAATTSTTTPPAATDNWAPSGGVTLSANTTVNSVIETADIHLGAHLLTINSGGIIFQTNNFWMQDTGGSVTTGQASGEFYVHAPDTTRTDTAFHVNIVDNGATPLVLIKDGPGRVRLTNSNSFTGGAFANGGILELNGGGGGAGTVANSAITVNAELDLNTGDALGFTNTHSITVYGTLKKINNQSETLNRPITLSGGTMTSTATFTTVNGAWNFFGGSISTVPSTTNYLNGSATGFFSLRNPNAYFNLGANSSLIINTPITQNTNTANTPLNLRGSGVLTLNASNGFTGVAVVNGGTLALGPAGTLGAGGATLAPGTLLDVSAYGSGYSLTSGVLTGGRTSSFATDVKGSLNVTSAGVAASANSTLTIGGNLGMSGGSLNYNVGGIVAVPNGSLTLGGTDYFLPQTFLAPGTYNLFTYNSGTPAAGDLVPGGPNSSGRQTYTFGASAGTVNVVITGSNASLYWRGGTWDNQVSTTSWFNATAGSLDKFYNADAVTFDDSAGLGNGTVSISGGVQPSSINVSNTAVGYVFSGTGSIVGGSSLAVNGPGSLTITNTNTYSGGTTLNGGLLALNSSNPIGPGILTINGGTLDCTLAGGGTLATNNVQNWNGDFTFNGTQNLNLGTGGVTLGSSRSVTVNGGTLTVRGVISDSGSGFGLRKAGPGNLTLVGVNTYAGNTTVNGGTLQLNSNNGGNGALASPTITVNAGGVLALNNQDTIGYTAGRNVLVINDGVVTNSTTGSRDTMANTITMTGGTLAGPGNGDGNGCYSIFTQSGSNAFVATSDGSGNPAVVNATSIGLQTSGSMYGIVVNRGTANPPADMIISSVIRPYGTGVGIAQSGNGILELTAVNTYAGSASVNGGTMQLGDGTTGHDGAFSNISTFTNNSSLVYNLFGNSSGGYVISGTGNVTKLGPGQLTLTGNNNYTGTTTVAGGLLNINGGDTSAALVANGGTLHVNVSSPTTTVTVASGAAFGGIGSMSGATANVANGGNLDFSQLTTGTFFLNSLTYAGASTLNLGPLANYTSTSPLNAGALTTAGQININANLGAAYVLAGTYDLVSYSSIAGTGTSAFNSVSVTGLNAARNQTAQLANLPGQLALVIKGDTPYWNGNQPDWLSTNGWTLNPSGSLTSFLVGDADVFDDTAGTGTFAGTVSLNSGNVAPGNVTFSNVGLAYTVSGNFGIAGNGALVVQGGGTVILANSNAYTGVTNVINGTLQLGNGGSTGSVSPSGAITLGNNGTLGFSRSNSMVQGVDFGGPISGGGLIVQNGPGALILTTTNTYTGSTNIAGGTLQLGTGVSGHDGSIPNTSSVNDVSTLAYNLFGSQTAAYTTGGAGNLYKTGPGSLTLTTTNTYIGGTVVNGGSLVLAPSADTGVGTIQGALTINPGGTVIVGAHDVFGYNTPTVTLSSLNINGGLLDKAPGTGVNETLTGVAVTMTGGTWAGTGGYFDIFTNANYSQSDSVTVNASSSTALISTQLNLRSLSLLLTVGSGTTPSGIDLLVSGQLTGGNGIIKDGLGVMELTYSSNTYTGATSILNGTLKLGDGTLPHDSALNGTNGVTDNGATIFAIAGTQTAAYAINGVGSLSMTGTGTVVLSNSCGYTGSTTVNAGKLYANGPLASLVTVNGGLFGGRGSSPGITVATGGSIEGGYNGAGALTAGSLAYSGSGTFVTNDYANFPGTFSAAALSVTAANGLSVGGSPIVINLGGPPVSAAGLYHLIRYSGSIGGSGFGAFTLGTTANNARGQLSFALANDPGYVDLSVSVNPVIWTGSLSTAWNANDTLPPPKNWSYNGSATNFQPGDLVQFDNNTASGGTVDISNGNVLPGGASVNNDAGHPYTLTGLNGIGGTGQLVKNGLGSLTIVNSNGYTGGTTLNSGLLVLNNNNAVGSGLLTITGGTLDSTAFGITLPNNAQNWNGDFTFNGSQNLNLGSGAVTLGSSRTVTVNANALTVNGAISDGGNGYSLTKAGPGSLMLGAASTFSGPTVVNGGTLQLNYPGNNATGALASPTITVNAGGFLALNANDVIGYTIGREVPFINDGTVVNITAANRVTFQNTVTMTGGTISGSGAGDGNGVYSIDAQNGADAFDATSDAVGHPAVINATVIGLQTGSGVIFNVTRGVANPASDMTITSNIIDFGGGAHAFTKSGNGVLVLTGTGLAPTTGSNYTGNVTISGGTLVAAAKANGNNTVLGNGNNGRLITVGSGAVLDIVAPNATAHDFNVTAVPTLNINGGIVTNGDPGATNAVNNALNNVNLNDGVLTATTGEHEPVGPGYGAWNINGIVTSTGNSLISTSDPAFGTVMLANAGASSGTTTVNVTSGTLTVSAPLVQDNADNNVSALLMTGPGTMVLTGSNNYTGGTIVNGGTMIVTTLHGISDGTNLSVGDPALLAMFPAPIVPSPAVSSPVATVPEPATLGLLAALVTSAVVYRRLRRR
jgi:autotransporter-associated beta strand protein